MLVHIISIKQIKNTFLNIFIHIVIGFLFEAGREPGSQSEVSWKRSPERPEGVWSLGWSPRRLEGDLGRLGSSGGLLKTSWVVLQASWG